MNKWANFLNPTLSNDATGRSPAAHQLISCGPLTQMFAFPCIRTTATDIYYVFCLTLCIKNLRKLFTKFLNFRKQWIRDQPFQTEYPPHALKYVPYHCVRCRKINSINMDEHTSRATILLLKKGACWARFIFYRHVCNCETEF